MKAAYRIAIEWDIATWSRALRFWEIAINRDKIALHKGLEIGARNGGITWFFAQHYGSQVYCTDYELPTKKAVSLHESSGLSPQIVYQKADATNLPYPDEIFDFVVFKSVLGVIGARNSADKIEAAMREMHRVLKPGGALFFAENQKGSWLHQLARRRLVRWGKKWYYLAPKDPELLLCAFKTREIHTTGFFSAFIPKPEWLKTVAAQFDPIFTIFPKSWRYVVYGYAIK